MSNRRLPWSDLGWSAVALGIIVAGIVGFKVLEALRVPVKAALVERSVPLVEVNVLPRHNGVLPITGRGFVQPRQQVALATEVPGRVVELHPTMFSLGKVRQGEVLVQLDNRNAQAALERAESDIQSIEARLELNASQLERAQTLRRRGVISQEELDQRLAERDELGGSLASLASARESARLSLESTQIKAPFDAQILSRNIEVGAIAVQGQALAQLFAPESLEVTVALEEREAALIPDLFSQGQAAAQVSIEFAGRLVQWPASVTRVGSSLSRSTRTLDVTVKIHQDDPLSASDTADLSSGTPPVLVNAWATVSINGVSSETLYAVPMQALREDNKVWLVIDDVLRIMPVRRIHDGTDTAYVALEAAANDEIQLITSLLTAPVDGMPVTIVSSTSESNLATGPDVEGLGTGSNSKSITSEGQSAQ